jgi:hypothetical protein
VDKEKGATTEEEMKVKEAGSRTIPERGRHVTEDEGKS